MWKKAVVILNILIIMFLLTGCWNYTEIDAQLNVSGFAIDVGEHGKKYHLSTEIITAEQKEKSPIAVNIVESDGDTVFEAIRNMMTLSSKKLYFGHCKTLVIGEKVARNGIEDILDLPVRNHELRTTIDVAISKGCSAKEILMSQGVATSIISYKINDLLRNSKKEVGSSPYFKTYLVYNSLQADGLSTVIPTLELTKINDKVLINLCGVGVFKKDKLVGFLDALQTKNLSLMNNKIKTGLITTKSVEDPNSNMSFELYKNKSKLNISFDNDEITVNITVKTFVNIGEVETKEDYTDSGEVERTRQHLERNLEDRFNQLIKVAQKDLKCDIFGVGLQINKRYPKKWDEYKENWEETFPKIKFNIKSDVRIIGSGVTSLSF